MNTTTNPNKTNLRKWIVAVSIVIPIAVAALFGIKVDGVDFSFLPPIYASINGITAVLLLLALFFIKNGKVQLHQKTIQVSLALSVLFLLCYVAYHMTSDSTLYGDLDANGKLDEIELHYVESSRLAYIILLLSHITLCGRYSRCVVHLSSRMGGELSKTQKMGKICVSHLVICCRHRRHCLFDDFALLSAVKFAYLSIN